MTDAISREIHKSLLTLERYRIATYANVELSVIDRDDGIIHIKPINECEIHAMPFGSGINIHAELYARFGEVNSILLLRSEWIGIASGAGWTLDRRSYGYIPSFTDTIPCTTKIRTHADSTDYPKAFCEAIADVSSVKHLPRAVLVRSRGAIVFAHSPMDAIEYAITLEYAAKKAFYIRSFR